MEKINYKIDHSNNNLKAYNNLDALQYKASWFLEFGKTTSEIYNLDNEIIYTIAKKFKFWKWRMSYNISPKNKESLVLISSNTTNSVFKLQLGTDFYEVQIHYFQKPKVHHHKSRKLIYHLYILHLSLHLQMVVQNIFFLTNL